MNKVHILTLLVGFGLTGCGAKSESGTSMPTDNSTPDTTGEDGEQTAAPNADKANATLAPEAAIAMARNASAPSILTPDPSAKPPLSGTIADYLAKMMSAPEYGEVVAKVAPCEKQPDHTCVELATDPCKRYTGDDSESCEGLYITLWIDVTAKPPVLERGQGPQNESITSEADVQRAFDIAP